MDEAARAALGRYGEQLRAEHLIAAGRTVLGWSWPAEHPSVVGTAGVRLDVMSAVRQPGGPRPLEHLQGAC